MALYKRGGRWWSRIQRNGEVFQRSTQCENKNDARDVEAVWKADIAKGEVGIYKSPTISSFSEQFLSYLPGRVGKRTFQFYVDAWQHILESSLANVKLSQIDAKRIDKFIKERLATTYTRGEKGTDRLPGITTVNHDLRTLRRALHLAEEWNLLRRAPKIALLRGEVQREHTIDEPTLQRFLSLCDSRQLEDAPFPARRFSPEMRHLIPFLMDTGLRIGELCRLDWADVNLQGQGNIFIRFGKTKHARRTVPLTSRARYILLDLTKIHTTPAVFHRAGKRIDSGWATHQFTDMRRELGLPDGLVLHSLRHTFCSRLGQKGASPYVIQKLAGHANITISARYTHMDAVQLEAAIGLLEAR